MSNKKVACTDKEIQQIVEWQKKKLSGKMQSQLLGKTYCAWKQCVKTWGLQRNKVNVPGFKPRLRGKWFPWTNKEIEQVKKWQECGISGLVQAKRLGRSYESWRNLVKSKKLQRYKLGDPYTTYKPEQRSLVLNFLQDGYIPAEISRMSKISHSKITKIIKELIHRGFVIKEGGHKGNYIVTKKWNSQPKGEPRPLKMGGPGVAASVLTGILNETMVGKPFKITCRVALL